MNLLYNMDCIEFMKALPDGCIDLIIADPPYFEVWGDFDFIWENEDEYLEWIYSCLREFYRILKPTGTLALWGTLKTYHDTFAEIIVWNKHNKLFKKKGCITLWNTRGPGVQNNFMSVSEQYLFYTKSDSYTFHPLYLMDEPINRTDKGANGKERKNKFKRLPDVWHVAEASQSSKQRCFHPTTKADVVCDRIVQSHSSEGDLVYVPFLGSGSEVISCIKNNRRFTGTELDGEYYEKGVERIYKRCKEEGFGYTGNLKGSCDKLPFVS